MDEEHPQSAMIIFSAALTRHLAEQRLAPHYIGLRRVRPSSRQVLKALRPASTTSSTGSTIVYKIVDQETGEERRMTAKEKKAAKSKARRAKLEEQRERQAEQKEETGDSPTDNNHYHQLAINASAIKEEIADIRGERQNVPPVALSPAVARVACLETLLPAAAPLDVQLDDGLAIEWASLLSDSMKRDEALRQQEDLRPMPYTITPEVWNRMRPSLGQTTEKVNVDEVLPKISVSSQEWAYFGIREDPNALSMAAVMQLLFRGTHLHISCGAKFGCDYLLYDGPREERHAFAGLRIIRSSDEETFPVPSSYDLAGYVRGLNTAGKLALLATVRTNLSGHRVAMVDLALEKVRATNFSGRSGKKAPKNLSKK